MNVIGEVVEVTLSTNRSLARFPTEQSSLFVTLITIFFCIISTTGSANYPAVIVTMNNSIFLIKSRHISRFRQFFSPIELNCFVILPGINVEVNVPKIETKSLAAGFIQCELKELIEIDMVTLY